MTRPSIKERVLKDWETFEAEVSRIFDENESKKRASSNHVSTPLFRGHADKDWTLSTTLERFTGAQFSIKAYYHVLKSVEPAVSSLTGRNWSFSHHLNVDESKHGPPPGYEFMIYLRHHGFPSPLLDWSRSPYVAAYFAFASTRASKSDSVAIYTYVEYLGEDKEWIENHGWIIGLGPYAVTHDRHYAQQSEYTICKKADDDRYVYCNHEEALSAQIVSQDSLTKYVVPTSERIKFLEKLDLMDINAYSMFRDESSLMQTLAYREIENQRA